MNGLEVIGAYHQLWHVEQSLSMSKHDLRDRPVFHHHRDAIEAHLSVVMTSLAIARWPQDPTGVSIKTLISQLQPLRALDVQIAGHTITATPTLTEQAQRITTAIHAHTNT